MPINYTRITQTMKKTASISLPLLLAVTLVYLPIFVNPDLLLARGNDLQEFFWPIYYFVKNQILNNHTLPLWNNLFLSGTPLLPDPQAPLFYLPNIIFLFLPIGVGFIVSSFLHTLFGGIGAYLLARSGLRLSKNASLFAAILYIITPRLAGFLEAGHFGLMAASAWLPFVFLATIKLARPSDQGFNIKGKWSVLLAISLDGLFYTHPTTFIPAAILSSTVFGLILLLSKPKKTLFASCRYFFLGGILTFGLVAISLLPQLEWLPETSRFVLANDRQVWPIWQSVGEFLGAIFAPWAQGKQAMLDLDSEKWLVLGIFPSILAILGFLKTRKWVKVSLLISVMTTAVLALNNTSPFYPLLLNQDWYVFGRVSTRIWFVAILITVYLASYGYQILEKKEKTKSLAKIIAFLAIVELLTISWMRISKPIPDTSRFATREVYEFLAKDKERFRVFCVNRCLSQKEAAKYGLELIEGYSTLQQMNYYRHAWQLTGTYWNYYTLAIPPIGSYKFEKLQPDAKSLGEYNTKYVISPHQLDDANFELQETIESYLIYQNKLVKPRAEVPISIYMPNHIRVDTSNYQLKNLVLSEVYSPGWKAYLNGEEEVSVQETPIAQRLVDIKPDTKFVDLKYQPESYKWGKMITFVTITLLLAWGIKEWKKP